MGRRWLLTLALAAACAREPDRAPPPTTTAPVATVTVDAAPAPADAAPAATTGDVLVLTPTPPPVGASWTLSYDAELTFELNVGGHAQNTSTKATQTKTVTALAFDGPVMTKARIAYAKRRTAMVIDDDPRADPSVIRGKTYLVEWKDGAVEVHTRGGRAASAAEIAEVSDEERSYRTFDLIAHALAGVRLPKGERVELPETMFHGLDEDGVVPERVVVTYAGREDDLARVDFVIAAGQRGGGMTLKVDLTGSALFDRTGWCRRAEIAAEIQAELNGSPVGGGVGKGVITVSARR